MDELVRQWTSLPNLHPALVHFPLALVPAAVGFEIAAFVRVPGAGLGRVACALWVMAGLAAGAAYWAGLEAAEGFGQLPPAIEQAVARHSDAAWYSLWSVGLLAVARWFWEWRGSEPGRRWARGAFVLAGLVGLGMLGWAADLGGALVYEHGVGVQAGQAKAGRVPEGLPAPAQAEAPLQAQDLAARLVRSEQGALAWRPAPRDGAALGALLRAAPGGEAGAVVWAGEAAAEGEGLPLEVRGRAWFVFPEVFGDVQVEAEFDLERYTGRLGLLHHVDDRGQGGFFDLDTDGRARLGAHGANQERILDEATVEWDAPRVRLAVSAVGRHLKGYVAGRSVVHGHAPAPPPGRCGLLFDGRGVVRLRELRVVPAGEAGAGGLAAP